MKLLTQNQLKHGLLMTVVTIVCLALMELTGQNQSFDNESPFQVLYVFLAPAIVWYLGIRQKRISQGNKLSFKHGFQEGFGISLAYALMSPFVFLFYYLFVNPPILDYVKTFYDMPDATNAIAIAVDMAVQFISAIIFGSIYAAIIAFFLKTKNA